MVLYAYQIHDLWKGMSTLKKTLAVVIVLAFTVLLFSSCDNQPAQLPAELETVWTDPAITVAPAEDTVSEVIDVVRDEVQLAAWDTVWTEPPATVAPAEENAMDVTETVQDEVQSVVSVTGYDSNWQNIDLPDLEKSAMTMGSIRLLDLSGQNVNYAPVGTVFGRYHFYSQGALKKSMTVSKPTLPYSLASKIASRGETYVFIREMDHPNANCMLIIYKSTDSWQFDIGYDWYGTYVGLISYSTPKSNWQISISNKSVSGMQYPVNDMSWYDAELGFSMSSFVISTDRDYRDDQSETAFTLPDKYIRTILGGVP